MNDRKTNWFTTACISTLAVCFVGLAICSYHETNRINELQEKYDSIYNVAVGLAKEVDNLETKTDDMYKEIDALRTELKNFNYETYVAESESVKNYNYDYVLRVVAAECRGEPFEGIMAVAQVIRERAEASGKTPEEIVKEKYQFAAPVSMDLVNDNVVEACARVLLNGESVTDKPIKYFYSTKNGFVSAGHEKKTYVMTIGYHKFFMD